MCQKNLEHKYNIVDSIFIINNSKLILKVKLIINNK